MLENLGNISLQFSGNKNFKCYEKLIQKKEFFNCRFSKHKQFCKCYFNNYRNGF